MRCCLNIFQITEEMVNLFL